MDQFAWPPAEVYAAATRIIDRARDQHLRIATAESCTGGLIAAALSEVPGASDVLDRAFVTYSNAAKVGLVNVDFDVIARHGAVSAEVACAMAEGALRASAASLAAAVTGIAGPTGGTAEKPVGLVYLATARHGTPARPRKCLFGGRGRTQVRLAALEVAMEMLEEALREPPV